MRTNAKQESCSYSQEQYTRDILASLEKWEKARLSERIKRGLRIRHSQTSTHAN